MTPTMIDIIGHASFALMAVSFAVRDIIMLRAVAIASGAVGMAYNYLIPAGPLWLVIAWLGIFAAINGARIASLVAERRAVSFNDEERELHETLFRTFAPVEFMKLMRIARWRDAAPGERLAEEGVPVGELTLLYNGEVVIERGGEEVDRSRDGALIGEISFIQGGSATATVRIARPSRLVVWAKGEVQGLLRRNPTMDVAMQGVFSQDLTRKLVKKGGGTPLPIFDDDD